LRHRWARGTEQGRELNENESRPVNQFSHIALNFLNELITAETNPICNAASASDAGAA